MLPLLIVLIGASSIVAGCSLPKYSDPKAVEQLHQKNAADFNDSPDNFYSAIAHYQTPHRVLIDVGSSTVSLGLTLCALLLIFKMRSPWDWRELRTPYSRGCFAYLVNAACICAVFAESFHLDMQLRRGDFPYWAEAILVPIFELAIATVVLLMILNYSILTTRYSFPSRLFDFPPKKFAGDFWSISILLVLLALPIRDFIESMHSGFFLMVPIDLTLVYLVLSGRAALLAYDLQHPADVTNKEISS